MYCKKCCFFVTDSFGSKYCQAMRDTPVRAYRSYVSRNQTHCYAGALLISIKSKFAQKIYNGEKTVEIRKKNYPQMFDGNVYISETGTGKVTGYFVQKYELPNLIFRDGMEEQGFTKAAIMSGACLSEEEFERYCSWTFRMIKINNPQRIEPIRLRDIGMIAPQGVRYIRPWEMKLFEVRK